MKTLKTLSAAMLVAILAPAAGLAQDSAVSPEQMQQLRDAMVSAGCVVASETTAGSVENTTGFAPELLAEIVEALRATGEIIDYGTEGGIQLTSGPCAN
ncbi:hypothetical protein EV663_11923 [Rhodovulum bhavnagarense]|uniref:Uncharacterized protein n=1 Tax=Rhodovulum bhavnagarense TaxID=992286 RepID=A0A4R2R7Q1_9RHOB|nr:hypothetical protein [Rhodovulum bhavnagarense]TCP58643.1 hypothetical protein EV663_11923 [Rhodovulum bhavnagarense]